MATIIEDLAALDAAKAALSSGDWFEPTTVKAEIEALRKILAQSPRPDLTAQITVAGQIISFRQLLADLWQFNRALNNPLDDRLFADLAALKPEHLLVLEKNLTAIIAPSETEKSMDAVVPANLQELLEAQATTTAELQNSLGRPSQLKQQIARAEAIGIRAQILRVNVAKSLFLTLEKSSYIRDLQTIYGKEAVNEFLAQKVDLAVNQSITALALNRLGLSDPSQAASYFTSHLEKTIKADANLATALAKTQKTERNHALADAKNLAEESIKELDRNAKEFRQEQASSPMIRTNAKNIAQGDLGAELSKHGKQLTPKQIGRLAETLAKYQNQPEKQQALLKRLLQDIPEESRQKILESARPAISVLARSSDNPTIAETINEASLINLVRTNTSLFPDRLSLAIRSNRLSTADAAALIIRLSQQLDQPPDYVMMRLAGISGKDLETHLNSLARGRPVLGMQTQPPVSLNNPIYRRLNAAQSGLNQIQASGEEIQTIGLGFQNSWQSITQVLDIGKALRYNASRLPPVNRMVSSVQTVFSGLRVQSGAVNSVFNFFSSVSGGFGKLGSAAAYPFRAVGSMVSTGWNNVKTWAGTQVKAGLAKAGAWLAKKGVTAVATKLGLMAVGKGAGALMAQAIPVVGQVVGALVLLSTLGDIGKFIWDHKKEIGLGLGGMFFLGQMLLAKVLGFLGSAAWTLGGALTGGILGMAFGPAGAFVGGIAGGITGYLIGSGTLGTALSGLGSALGSAAAGISSFIGSLTAPSLVAGVGTTIATVVIGGLTISATIDAFFTKPRTNSGMFVPTERSSSFPRDGSGGDIPPVGTCTILSSGFCSPSYLSPTFGTQTDNAAQICNRESIGGNPVALNDSCLDYCGDGGDHSIVFSTTNPSVSIRKCTWVSRNGEAYHTGDYSAGLFQTNLLCSSHFEPSSNGTPKECYKAFAVNYCGSLTCPNVSDWTLLANCVAYFWDPDNSVAYSNNQSSCGDTNPDTRNWGPWTTARSCGIQSNCTP